MMRRKTLFRDGRLEVDAIGDPDVRQAVYIRAGGKSNSKPRRGYAHHLRASATEIHVGGQ